MAKTTEASATALKTLNGSATSPSESDQHVKTDNKRDLFKKFKLKKAMKKQLDTGQSDHETQEQNFVLQNEEKEAIQAKLYDMSGQYQVIKHQLEAKESELEVAMSKVEAYELELEAQQETTSVKQQKDATMISTLHDKLEKTVIGLSQEEARVLVFQEENNRLTSQVVGMLEDKKQQEREMKRLVKENECLQMKMNDLMQQLKGTRQQQEETEQMYLELALKLNHALRENDQLKKTTGHEDVGEDADCVRELEMQMADWQTSAEKWEQEKQRLTQQIELLTSANEKASAELTDVALIREQLLVHVGIDLTYESIESLLDTKNNEIQMLTAQLSIVDGFQEQAICEAIGTSVVEAEALRSHLKTLHTQYDFAASEKLEQGKTIDELRTNLERVAEEHSSLLLAKELEYRGACEALAETEHLVKQLENAQTEKQQLSDDFSAIESKIESLVTALQIEKRASADDGTRYSYNSRVAKLNMYLEHIQEQLLSAAKTNQRQGETEILQDRIHRYEVENQLVAAKLEECEVALKSYAEKFAVRGLDAGFVTQKYAFSGDDAGSVISNGETAESYNGDSPDLERKLESTRSRLHAIEAEMAACKAENLRMIFEVAKTADGVSKLKQDHETLLETHREKSSELETMVVQFASLESANQRLASELASKSDEQRRYCEAFALQREDFESIIADLYTKAARDSNKIKHDLADIKTENDVLEERISELHAVADSKTELDERQEKDREVEELRSSLVQAKVNFFEQKQQLSALEKKLVDVSKLGGSTCTMNAALDAERREFEAALIEMIEMEKKLQAAYEAKQGLESTLQERMEAKAELEDRLSVAEDKIAELEQQLEQKVALITTIEEQLRSVEEERGKLADEYSKTRLKLERSRGKLEEKAIEFEAFKTTTDMLKDERSRLFSEIALLKDKIAKSEAQKAAMADSQELANEELEEQLNELADKIAEIEVEKQELRARLEDTVYQSEEDIHQLRERLYMLEEEKSGMDDENLDLERTVKDLEVKLSTLEEQKAKLEAANESSCHQLTLLENRVEKAANEIAALSVEKNTLIDLQQLLEGNLSALQDEKVGLERTLEETTSKLRDELEKMTARDEALQTQLAQSAAEKEELLVALSELQVRSQTEKLAYNEAAVKLESQISDNNILENKVRALKHMAEKALQSLQINRDELSETESRAAILVEERDTVSVLLREKESANEALTTQCSDLQLQVDKLNSDLESLGCKQLEEAGVAKETIRSLTEVETKLTESLESLRRDLAEAESCIMVLDAERDEVRRDLAAKDLKIEMMTTQQGELGLAAEKLENELNKLRDKSAAEATATEEMICGLQKAKAYAEETVDNLKDSLLQAEKSLCSIQEQLTESECHVKALEKDRDAMRSFLTEKESTHEMLSTVQEELQKKVDALKLELKELRKTSSAELAVANKIITCLQLTQAEEAEKLAIVRQELADAEGCVLVLVEERDVAKKILSKRELTLEVLSSEHGELQLKSQSMTTVLDALRKKAAVDARAAEISIQTSKQEVQCATESLKSVQKKLVESELRAASLAAECEAVSKMLSTLDTEHKSLSSQKQELEHYLKNSEAKIKNLETQHAATLESYEEKICVLKTSEAEHKELLEIARRKLLDSESRSESLADERDSINNTLHKAETIISNLTTQAKYLQEQTQSLVSELQELQSQRESETQAAEETVRSLKESESQTAETLEAIRQELAETKAQAVSAEEEREAVRKALSEMESHREAQSTEATSLQKRIQSLKSELQELQSQRESETQAAEETIRSLKESESQTAETLEAIRQELAETKAQAVSAEEEREAVRKALSEMESHREAQSTEATSLQKRIQSLKSELQELQSQRESETQAAEETIRSLKESESQTAETLEAIRQELAETKARAVSAEEEREAVHKALSEMELHREAQSTEATSLQKRIQSLKSELQELQSQRESETQAAEETIRSLKESESQTAETLEAIRQELAETKAQAVSAEEEREAVRKALSEMESHREAQSTEATSLQKRIQSLKSELQELQSQRESETQAAEETIRSLKESESQTAETLEAIRQELAETKAQAVSAEEEREAVHKALSEMESHREAQSTEATSLQKRIQSLKSELQELQSQRESETQAAEETIRSLKESESQTAETLEAIRQELAETKAQAVSAEEEREAVRKALSEMESHREAQSTEATSLQKRIQSLKSELQELQSQRESETQAAEETIRSLKESESQTAETLEAIRQELAETKAQAVSAEEEREAVHKALSEMESHREAQSTEATSLQKRIQSLKSELQELQSQRESETQAAEETIRSLKESESQTAETLEAIRQELAETKAQAVSAEEEREAVRKALSEMESHREAQSTEATSLQKRIQSLKSELQELQSQRESETQAAEETIRSLKESESQTAETLEAIRQELAETKAQAVSAEEEREAVHKALSEMESHREAQSTEATSLQKRIQSLKSELQELQSQRESETQAAEETIRSLKESESQTAETLEAIRQELAETKARAVLAEDKRYLFQNAYEQNEALLAALYEDKDALVERVQADEVRIGELDAALDLRTLELSKGAQKTEMLESQLAQTETQLRDVLKEIKTLKEEMALLSEASSSAVNEVNSLHEQRVTEEESYAAGIARKDEVILKLKSKLEEVMAAYKRLKGHLQELQDRLAQQVTIGDYLKTSYDELNAQYSASTMELDALKLELASSREQSAAMAEKLRLSGEKVAESEAQHKIQVEIFEKRVSAYEDEVAQMRRQHDVVLQEQKEKLLTASAARDESVQLEVAKLEKSLAVLTEIVEQKELEIQSMAERMRHIEEKHVQAGSAREETARKHEAKQMELEVQLSSANKTIEKFRSAIDANDGTQHETMLQFEKQISQLQLEAKVETEGATAARVALETYKKRAHTALKKASRENKLNLKKAAESTNKLEGEILSAKVRISVLETELEETRRRMEEVGSVGDALAQSACNALEADKRSQEAALRLEIESLKAEVIRLKEAMDSEKVPLESQIKQLAERNEALSHEISLLKERARTENDAVEQAVQAKEEEINDLSKQLRAALAAAASLATNEAERRSYTPSSSPTEKERRSTASSSRSFDSEGNNSYVHQTTLEKQHERISAAVGISCPVPLASKITAADGVEQQSKALVNGDDEVIRLTLLLNEVQSQFHVFQKKYEDASALLEEANRQKQHLERSTQEVNIEYLKNVVIKYIKSQVPREKEQLLPVIAALLSFSPQEHHQVMVAHSKANDEGAGLFGGVFSLFGGGATTKPSPKFVAAPPNFKPLTTTARRNEAGAALGSKGKHGVLSFGSDSSDDEELVRSLNPFAA